MDGIKKVDAFDRKYFTPGAIILLAFNGPYHGFGAGRYHAIIEECGIEIIEGMLCKIAARGNEVEMSRFSVEISDYVSGRVGIEIIRRLTK